MKRTHATTRIELHNMVCNYCEILSKRINKKRISSTSYNDSNDWDYPKVAVCCGSNVPPYLCASGKNCSDLRNPHKVLLDAFPCKIGTKPLSNKAYPKAIGEESFACGHCAEPHAVQKLITKVIKIKKTIQISDVLFGPALRVCNKTPRDYCYTCRLTFPQLRRP